MFAPPQTPQPAMDATQLVAKLVANAPNLNGMDIIRLAILYRGSTEMKVFPIQHPKLLELLVTCKLMLAS